MTKRKLPTDREITEAIENDPRLQQLQDDLSGRVDILILLGLPRLNIPPSTREKYLDNKFEIGLDEILHEQWRRKEGGAGMESYWAADPAEFQVWFDQVSRPTPNKKKT